LYHHLCLDRAYSSTSIENEIIRRGYVPHTPYKKKRSKEERDCASTETSNYEK